MKSHSSPKILCLVYLASAAWCLSAAAQGQEAFRLENGRLGLSVARDNGTLVAIQNKLAGETYLVRGDTFTVEAVEFQLDFADAKLITIKQEGETLKVQYQGSGMTVDVAYALTADHHFAEKRLTLTCNRACGLKRVVLSRPAFSAADLRMVAYRHPKLGLNRGAEPASTYFGRTPKGGFFVGVEMPFDASSTDGRQVVLQYAPNLKLAAGERLVCEPVYCGVYRRGPLDEEKSDLPLASESDAMVAMTSALLPAQNRRLGPMMCGWWSETFRGPYRTPADVEHDMRSIDFAVACGIDIVSDGRTWSGETEKVNALREGEKLQFGELPLKLAAYARQKGVRWVFWPAMGNSDPWSGRGKPFRSLDKPEWRMAPRSAACFAYQPCYDWLVARILEATEAGQYGAWCMDGDFFGEPGFGGGPGYNGGRGPKGEPAEPWVHPARCQSADHDHLTPDVNYICQRNLIRLAGLIRKRYPDIYLFCCRPTMDLGVWALPYMDACFTINEWASVQGIPGMGPQPKNVVLGDKIRHWSRVRVHHHFFPHYLDSPLVFDAPKSMSGRDWTSEKIDYILLSALSSSPNQTYYLPSQAGIPDADKQEIKKWLDWGRKNIDYLMVRKDLPDWPAPGKVDGSAHLVVDRGLVFLFNPNKQALEGRFALSQEEIGLAGKGRFRVAQQYPVSQEQRIRDYGDQVRWSVPPETAVVLEIRPAPGTDP